MAFSRWILALTKGAAARSTAVYFLTLILGQALRTLQGMEQSPAPMSAIVTGASVLVIGALVSAFCHSAMSSAWRRPLHSMILL